MIPCCESGTQQASTGLEVFLVLCRASLVKFVIVYLVSQVLHGHSYMAAGLKGKRSEFMTKTCQQ